MVEVKGVLVEKYRNIADLYIPWDKNVLIFGKNAAGKSNLLEALSLFRREDIADYLGSEEYSVSFFYKTYDFFQERDEDPQDRFEAHEKAWKVGLLLSALGIDSREFEKTLNWCFQVTDSGEIDIRGPFLLDEEDIQLLEKAERDESPLAGLFGYSKFRSKRRLIELTDEEVDYLSCDKATSPNEIIVTREHKTISDIVSTAKETPKFTWCEIEFKPPFFLPETGKGPWMLVVGRRDHLVDLSLSLSCLMNRLGGEPGGDIWPDIIQVFLNGIGMEVSLSRNEEDGEFVYRQGRRLLPDAIDLLRKRKKFYSVLEKSRDLQTDDSVSELKRTIAKIVCEWKPDILARPPEAPFMFEAPFFEVEEDPRTVIMHHISAIATGDLEARVEKAVEERVLTWLQMMKWFDESTFEDAENEHLIPDITLFDCDLREYVERCELAREKTCGYYLREIEEEANRWLDGLLGDAIRVSISCRDQFEDGFVSIVVKDFGGTQEFPYANSSSGARRWVDIAVSMAIDKFSDLDPIIAREDVKVFSDTVDDETGVGFGLSVFDLLSSGDLEALEAEMTINEAVRFRRHQELTRKPLAIIDEPELHMHHGLQKRLSKSLETLSGGMKLIMASHSVEFLNMDPKQIRFMNLKSTKGKAELVAIEGRNLRSLREIARDLGATSGQLFQMTSALLFVEGYQDERLIRKLCASRIAREGIWPISMDGILAQNSLKSVIRLIAAHMDIPVGIMYDNVREELSHDLNDPHKSGDLMKLNEAGLRRRYQGLTGEERALVRAFRDLDKHGIRPISLGVPVRDITVYLSDKHLRAAANMPNFPGLEVVAEAFESFRKKEVASNRNTGKKKLTGFKEFCKQKYHLDISDVLEEVLNRMRSDGTKIQDIERRLDILVEAAEVQSLVLP